MVELFHSKLRDNLKINLLGSETKSFYYPRTVFGTDSQKRYHFCKGLVEGLEDNLANSTWVEVDWDDRFYVEWKLNDDNFSFHKNVLEMNKTINCFRLILSHQIEKYPISRRESPGLGTQGTKFLHFRIF